MSRESLVFVFGFLVFIIPFLGLPKDWKQFIFIASGVFLMILGYSLRRSAFIRSIEKESGERTSEEFSESVRQEDVSEDTERPV